MDSLNNKARLAGWLYVITGLPNVFYLVYAPSVFTSTGDATARVGRIVAAEGLFRLSIVAELVGAISFIFVVLALHDLLKDVNRKLASLMVTLFVVSVPISCVNVLSQIAVLKLLSGADFLAVFDARQLDAMVMVFLSLHSWGVVVAQIFWGLWLLPFGILVYRSGFLPRFLGVLLAISCFAYVASSAAALLLPAGDHMVSHLMTAIGGVGELAIILWLLIKGVQVRPSGEPQTSSAIPAA